MTRNFNNANRPLRIERLEQRQLLCGAAATGSLLQAAAHSALVAGAHTSSAVTNTLKSSTSSGASDESTDTYFFATLTNSSGEIVGTASFETEVSGTTTKESLVIAVVGGAANASYEVTVGTTDLGALTTDANGNGRLILTSSTSTSSTTSSAATANCAGTGNTTTGTLPTGFTLAAGATINLASTDTTVDPLNGTFAASTGEIGEGNGNGYGGNGYGGCHGSDASITRSVATLTDSASGATVGKSVFTTITHSDGTTVDILRVHLTGTDVSSTFDVSVDGTDVGSITTDANGNGYLILSSNPKTSNVGQLPSGITSPTAITITNSVTGTTITGNYSASSSSSAAGGVLASANRFFLRRW
ncbi:MAG TPA: hypothetical protein VMJ32_09870 [Pirellulales bacterium]|nr:hypothetical protein [Pirellulales bacterium]